MMLRALLSLLALLLAAATALRAQEEDDGRTLRWRALEVDARLDEEGRLHVTERQAMVFDGAWNGGERRFDLRPGQRLRVEEITRLDPATGTERLLRRGDLDEVDRWDREDGRVRWRSRRPDDPPFRQAELVYTLRYTLAPVLLRTDEGYLLHHDFAFADREGAIDTFALRLELDPAWRAPAGFRAEQRAAALLPGRGYVVRLPLQYAAGGAPAAVPEGPSRPVRVAIAAALVLLPALLLRRFFRRERAAGRWNPLPAPDAVDEGWLRAEVFRYPPEVVGAAWDRAVGAPEVAALLARLVQEGKLASRVEPGRKPVLHLSLRGPRTAFQAHERELIDALFPDGRTETSTEEIRKHYAKKGFDPARLIRPALEERLSGLPGRGALRRRWGAPLALLGLGVAVLVGVAATEPLQTAPALVLMLMIPAFGAPAAAAATVYARRAAALRTPAAWLGILAAAEGLLLAAFVFGGLETGPDGELGPLGFYHPTVPLLLGVVALFTGWVAVLVTLARTTDGPARLGFRRRLAAARAHFEAELRRPDPRLSDEWFPYLLALGLGSEVDQWFEAFGPAGGRSAGAAIAGAAAAGGGGTGGSGPPSGGWTGGGPAFGGGTGGGGGAGGAWGVAAASLASGVPAPGSGGAGGGGVSGGGGGGGW